MILVRNSASTSSPILRSFQRASFFLALVAATGAARADHFYGAWLQEFDRTSNKGQSASAVTTDSRGNVIVAGDSIAGDGFHQFYVAKYDGLNGSKVWERFFGTTQGAFGVGTPIGDAFARSVAVDGNDAVIVTGGATLDSNQQEDYVTIKYDSAGFLAFAKSFDGTNSGQDEAQKVAIDGSNNVIVTGFSYGDNGAKDDYDTIKYSSTGTVLWERRYNLLNAADDPAGLALDSAGNVWVTGASDANGTVSFLTVKYSSAGALLFARTYLAPGQFYGATSVACDAAGAAFVTGTYTDASKNHGYYTVKYTSAGTPVWSAILQSGFDDHFRGAQSVAVDSVGDPIVAGTLAASNGTAEAVTIKYNGASVGTGVVKWKTIETGISPLDAAGLPSGNTFGRQVLADRAGNVILIGDSEKGPFDADLYLAKYDGTTGAQVYGASYGGDFGAADLGVAGALDAAGNIAFTGTEKRKLNGTGLNGIATIKFQRIVAETGDPLPPHGSAARKISLLNSPALADNGDLAVRITLAEGKTKLGALLTQTSAGGSQLPVIQKDPAPNVPGSAGATFASFGEPIVSPSGAYAFPAKLSGVPAGKTASVWTNLGGTLHLALQQGMNVPGLAGATFASVSSISLRDSQLVALVKIVGAASSNTVLLSLNAANTGTVLLRTGPASTVTLNGAPQTYVKTITVLSSTTSSPGDGRWQGDSFMLAKVGLADGRTVIDKISPSGTVTPMLYTGQSSTEVAAGTTWKTFGLPAVGLSGFAYSALGTLDTATGVTTSSDTAIVYSPDSTNFSLVAREGASAAASTGLTGISYSALSDPVVSASGRVAFLATLKATTGSGVKVAASNNRALLFANGGTLKTIARTGQKAPDEFGTAGASAFSAFNSIALPGGAPGQPLFVATLTGGGATAKTNSGVWTVDTRGVLRQLIRTGDKLGEQTVSKITLLKAVAQEFAAARSFNSKGGVVFQIGFTDGSTGVLELGVP